MTETIKPAAMPAPSQLTPAAPRESPSRQRRWFSDGELRCKGPGCGKPIPAGYYGRTKKVFYCCFNCQYRWNLSQRKPIKCTYCRKLFTKTGTAPTRPFCSLQHYFEWRKARLDREKAGRFTKVLHEFMEEVAPKRYAKSTLNVFRCNLAAFFDFLNRSGIRSLNSVGPKTVSAFLSEIARRRKKSAGKFNSHLRLFFDWLIFEGRRTKPNPVIAMLHDARLDRRLPRPFSTSEMAKIWEVLEHQQNAALCLAVALGQEAGLRISEVANLRMQDVDPVTQEVFVRLPNKTRTERYVPFHDKTRKYLAEWLAVRGERSYDFVFVGSSGRPMTCATLRILLNRLMKSILQGWCFHRLRHVAASTMYRHGADNTAVMRTFGWRSPAVMEGYTEVLPGQLRDSYDRAFQAQAKGLPGSTTTRSMEEFFSNGNLSSTTVTESAK